MLILTRKIDQSVYINVGDKLIKVIVLGVEGDRVKLGFDAGQEVVIMRSELVADFVPPEEWIKS